MGLHLTEREIANRFPYLFFSHEGGRVLRYSRSALSAA
jgi:hypothetical protein